MHHYRRFLLDMHIPDWDEALLGKYDPCLIVEEYARLGADSVMIYCQSHTGLAYWPTKVGARHRALRGRDFVGETLELLRSSGIEALSYYSLTFNNLAFERHPEWRFKASAPMEGGAFTGKRYGIVCPNNLDYRDYALSEVRELFEGYRFDGAFFDMTFWPGICTCPSCSSRYREEQGVPIPERVDWFSRDWCRFQKTREQWLVEYAHELGAEVKRLRPELPVFHNSAVALFNWTRGFSFEMTRENEFLGGDFYGDSNEQLVVSKLMTNLSRGKPVEFMTSLATHLTDHGSYKQPIELELQALSSLQFSAAFRFIDAVNPDGTVGTNAYPIVRKIFERYGKYEPFLGGLPVEEIAVYVSDDSKMSFAENGRPIGDPGLRSSPMPHIEAVRGAVRALQEAHLPFGIITSRQLPRLADFRVVVLPNLLRMNRDEVEAFRRYVEGGGRLYASGLTSLTETDGVRLPDFMLGNLFSAELDGSPSLSSAYLTPIDDRLRSTLHPRERLSVKDYPEIALSGTGTALATLTLPYGFPADGTVFDHNWASIHSSPPWTDTGRPLIVESSFGKGRVIYSSPVLEGDSDCFSRSLFTSLIRRLLPEPPAYESDTHPAVWIGAHRQPESKRLVITLLNYQTQLPPIPIHNLAVRLRFSGSAPLPSAALVPKMTGLAVRRVDDSRIELTIDVLDTFSMVLVEMA